MAVIYCARILISLCLVNCIACDLTWEQKLEDQCMRFGRNSSFDTDLIVSKQWRVYFSWNLVMKDRCLLMKFKLATPFMIQRFYSDMREHLMSQPVWSSAILYMTVGKMKHELLLFPDLNGSAGRLTGVPNLLRRGYSLPYVQTIPLKKIFMKLLEDGKYLLIMECSGMGISYLAAHADTPPNRLEIDVVAAEQELEDGHPACKDGALDK